MQPVAVELAELILPAQLPFAEDVFFEGMMGLDDHHRSRGLESDASFNTNDRVAYMDVTANSIGACDLLQVLYGIYGVVELTVVDGQEFALVKSQHDFLASVARQLGRKSALGKHAQWIERFLAADGRSPDPLVDGIHRLLEVHRDPF